MHPDTGLADTLKPKLPQFEIGDTVDVHVKIQEGDKERIQVFTGTVIARKGSGLSASFTVRRVVQGHGVERIFPMHAPTVAAVKVRRHGEIRRAKLYFLRDRVGKGVKLRERLKKRGIEVVGEDQAIDAEEAKIAAEATGQKAPAPTPAPATDAPSSPAKSEAGTGA
jgi:large subunit ribosomal protein L19